ncbi:hypothetical protein [Bradyrhizobium lupini]
MEAAQEALIEQWGEKTRDQVLSRSLSELYAALGWPEPLIEEEQLAEPRL